jgi:hypothetical protein
MLVGHKSAYTIDPDHRPARHDGLSRAPLVSPAVRRPNLTTRERSLDPWHPAHRLRLWRKERDPCDARRRIVGHPGRANQRLARPRWGQPQRMGNKRLPEPGNRLWAGLKK